jgi:nucleoside phosphorylase
MLYILSASKIELKYFLKKIKMRYKIHGVDVFTADKLMVVITGIGKKKVQKTINIIKQNFAVNSGDIVINAGLAGGFNTHIGETYQIDRIISDSTILFIKNLRLFYKTGSIYSTNKFTFFNNENGANLIDMEAATVYQELNGLVKEIYIIKCISDQCYDKENNITDNLVNFWKKIAFLFNLKKPISRLNMELEKVVRELIG